MQPLTKPILKWLIGRVREEGWQALQMAIENTQLLYGTDVDYAVCFNHVSSTFVYDRLLCIAGQPLMMVDQTPWRTPPESEYGWKFYPLKLTDDRRELWMDNDLILFERHPLIDGFLFGPDELFLFLEDVGRCYAPSSLDNLLPSGRGVNGGLLAIPGISESAIKTRYLEVLERLRIPPSATHWTSPVIDANGAENASIALLELTFADQSRRVSHGDIPVGSAIREGAVGTAGMHFTGLNRGPKPAVACSFQQMLDSPMRPRRPSPLPPGILCPASAMLS